MEHQKNLWTKRLTISFIVLLFLLLLAWLFPYYDHILVMICKILLPFLIAIVLSLLLHPLVRLLEDAGMKRSFAILLLFAVFFTLAGFGIYRGYPKLIEQLKLLSEQLPQLMQAYQGWTQEFYEQTERFPDGIHHRLDGSFTKFEGWLSARVMSVVTGMSGIFDFILLVAVIPVMTFYFLKDDKVIFRACIQILPKKWHDEAHRLGGELSHSLGGYIRGQLLISLFVGVLASIGFWLAGVPYPLVLGIVAGITNIIPYFGPLLGAVPASIVALTVSVKTFFFALIAITVIQVLEGNLLSPYIMGKSIHIHPLLIIFALIAGGELAGIPGMILAVPALTCLKAIILEVRRGQLEH
ncbi:AI-2E family transporter [Halobacillus salinarum]|uniref:AI-2E family transporter n=1 Tax=Halobacillus salinarum TaxID=2932257 RepID=A0ABY4EQ14_9BACI|nr:AI-2E family transporter [Halobacillus salinarum]UOQ46294.1 AI-2E family transporter [Halobacillus salinarum]